MDLTRMRRSIEYEVVNARFGFIIELQVYRKLAHRNDQHKTRYSQITEYLSVTGGIF
jgi:hypothetical protein